MFPHSCCACAAWAAEQAQACTTILLDMLSSCSAQRGPRRAACSPVCSQPGTKTLNSVICRRLGPHSGLGRHGQTLAGEGFHIQSVTKSVRISIQTRLKTLWEGFPQTISGHRALKQRTTLNINLNNHAVKKQQSSIWGRIHKHRHKKRLEVEVLLFCNSSSSCWTSDLLPQLHAAADEDQFSRTVMQVEAQVCCYLGLVCNNVDTLSRQPLPGGAATLTLRRLPRQVWALVWRHHLLQNCFVLLTSWRMLEVMLI